MPQEIQNEPETRRLELEERLELADGVLGAGDSVALSPAVSEDLVIVATCGSEESAKAPIEEVGEGDQTLTLVGLVAKEVDLLEVLLLNVTKGVSLVPTVGAARANISGRARGSSDAARKQLTTCRTRFVLRWSK